MRRYFKAFASVFLLWALTVQQVSASPLFISSISGVEVGANTYNVLFQDGPCVDLFGGCTASQFTFDSNASASAASEALLSRILRANTDAQGAGLYLEGCISPWSCTILTPHSIEIGGYNIRYVSAASASIYSSYDFNNDTTHGAFDWKVGGVSSQTIMATYDTSFINTLLYAIWVPVTPTDPSGTIPEPTSIALFGIGALAFAARCRSLRTV